MGIFNFFITLPEIIPSLAFGRIMNTLLGNRLLAVIGGGSSSSRGDPGGGRRDLRAPETMAQRA
jgi:hypothetical protein